MIESKREKLIRQYAAGKITWSELRNRGFENYVQVLGALGELGLRPPIARMEGPNVAASAVEHSSVKPYGRGGELAAQPHCDRHVAVVHIGAGGIA